MNKYILQMNSICKSFNGIKALNNACLNVRYGTVHALMGENGAGKSTLMKCLFGILKKDSGTIIFDKDPIVINNSKDALNKGIVMVSQEIQPLLERSIAENIFCGHYPIKNIGPFKIIDHEKMYTEANKYLQEVGLPCSSKVKLSELSISQMQLVEIAKALSIKARLIILDEPTSSLTEKEVAKLFKIIDSLRSKGVAFIYISHKMEEILEISDEVTIMRDGNFIGTWESADLTTDTIIKYMVGRELTNRYPKKEYTPGEVVLKVDNYTSINDKSYKNVSFELREKEILGIGGLVGSQRTELMEGIFGISEKKTGTITFKGNELTINSPNDAIKNGFALITEDRHASGIFPDLSIRDNICITSINNYLDNNIVINEKKLNDATEIQINNLHITKCKDEPIKILSGGNQQKVLFGRWLANVPDILILDEPTRGIDVSTKYDIYCIINELAKNGKSIIIISSEMSELLGMSDRIIVMSDGRISGELNKDDATQEKIMSLATKYI